MKIIYVTCLLLLVVGCQNKLTGKPQTLQFTCITWACDCANWIEPDTAAKYESAGGDALASHCIFIEPADTSLALPDTLGYNNDVIEFTGQFYKYQGFPKGYKSIEPVDKARVFRYTAYKIIESHHHAAIDTTQ